MAYVFEPAAHLMNPPHRLAVGHQQQDGAVVNNDLHVALVVLDAKLVVLRHLAASRGAPFRGPRWGCAPRAGSVRCLGRSGTEPSRTLTPTSGPHIPILGGAYLLPRAGDPRTTPREVLGATLLTARSFAAY